MLRFFSFDSHINRLVYIQGSTRLWILLVVIIMIGKSQRKNKVVIIHRYYLITLKISIPEKDDLELKEELDFK